MPTPPDELPDHAEKPTKASTFRILAQETRTTPAPQDWMTSRVQWHQEQVLLAEKLTKLTILLKRNLGHCASDFCEDDVIAIWIWLTKAKLSTLARDLLTALNLEDNEEFTLKLLISQPSPNPSTSTSPRV